MAQDDHLYLFVSWETGDGRPEILARIPVGRDMILASRWSISATDDKWHAGLEPEKAKLIMQHGASEMSVNYHPDLKKWIAVHGGSRFSPTRFLLSTAPSMTGPWTEGEVIYHVPELQKDNPHYDKDTFCYAGKEHPEFEKPGRTGLHVRVQQHEAEEAGDRAIHLHPAGGAHAHAGVGYGEVAHFARTALQKARVRRTCSVQYGQSWPPGNSS